MDCAARQSEAGRKAHPVIADRQVIGFVHLPQGKNHGGASLKSGGNAYLRMLENSSFTINPQGVACATSRARGASNSPELDGVPAPVRVQHIGDECAGTAPCRPAPGFQIGITAHRPAPWCAPGFPVR